MQRAAETAAAHGVLRRDLRLNIGEPCEWSPARCGRLHYWHPKRPGPDKAGPTSLLAASVAAVPIESAASLAVLVEEVEHAFQVGPDDVAVRATRHFYVLVLDPELHEGRDHAA